MPIRTAEADWTGTLDRGSGHMRLGSGAFDGPFDFRSRMGDGQGTNPEELLGAALAGCFSMALAAQLRASNFDPKRVHTTAKVRFEQRQGNWSIQAIDLDTEVSVQRILAPDFQKLADKVKKTCPVSQALAGVTINHTAKLVK